MSGIKKRLVNQTYQTSVRKVSTNRSEKKSIWTYWKTPEAEERRRRNPWWLVGALYLASVHFSYTWLSRDLTPHTWVLPPENDLLKASGTFLNRKSLTRSPYYIFNSDTDGHSIDLGCNPEGAVNACLEAQGITLRWLSDRHVTIGYFQVQGLNPRAPTSVLTTIDFNGHPLLRYADSKRRIDRWAVEEEQLKRSPLKLIMDLLLPIIFAAIAIVLTVAKLRYWAKGDSSNGQ